MTRPEGPIQLLSTAHLKKKATPRTSVMTPMRLTTVRPTLVSSAGFLGWFMLGCSGGGSGAGGSSCRSITGGGGGEVSTGGAVTSGGETAISSRARRFSIASCFFSRRAMASLTMSSRCCSGVGSIEN